MKNLNDENIRSESIHPAGKSRNTPRLLFPEVFEWNDAGARFYWITAAEFPLDPTSYVKMKEKDVKDVKSQKDDPGNIYYRTATTDNALNMADFWDKLPTGKFYINIAAYDENGSAFAFANIERYKARRASNEYEMLTSAELTDRMVRLADFYLADAGASQRENPPYFTHEYIEKVNGEDRFFPLLYPGMNFSFLGIGLLDLAHYLKSLGKDERSEALRKRAIALCEDLIANKTNREALVKGIPYAVMHEGSPEIPDIPEFAEAWELSKTVEPASCAYCIEFYIRIFQETGDAEYLTVAANLADRLNNFMMPEGCLPARINRKTGEITGNYYSTANVFAWIAYESLHRVTGEPKYLRISEKIWKWLNETAVPNMRFAYLFSDIPATAPGKRLSCFDALAMAMILIEKYDETGEKQYLRSAENIYVWTVNLFTLYPVREHDQYFRKFNPELSRIFHYPVVRESIVWIPCDYTAAMQARLLYELSLRDGGISSGVKQEINALLRGLITQQLREDGRILTYPREYPERRQTWYSSPPTDAGYVIPLIESGIFQDPDANKIYLRFDGSVEGFDGERPVRNKNVVFKPGIKYQGAYFAENTELSYRTYGNFSLKKGFMDFYIIPEWRGDDNLNHPFVTIYMGLGGFLWCGKYYEEREDKNYLYFQMERNLKDYNQWIRTDISSWKPDDPHRIRLSWNNQVGGSDKDEIKLSIDNAVIAKKIIHFPDYIDSELNIGWDPHPVWGAPLYGVIDEFRISDQTEKLIIKQD